MSAKADERAFVHYDWMSGYGAEPTPGRPTGEAHERRFLADKRTLAGRRLSDFRLLGHLECIVYLDPKVSPGAFNFCMAQQQLHGANILGASIDQRRFRASHGVRAIRAVIESDRRDPTMIDSRILARRDVRRSMQPTRKQIIGRLQSPRRDPGRDTLTGLLRDFKLHRSMSFLLHESRASYDMTSHGDVLHLQSRQIARPKLAVDCKVEKCQLATRYRQSAPPQERLLCIR
jgi:hypothetical protein